MHRAPDEATKLIEGGDMEQWIERAIEDKAIKMRFEKSMESVQITDRSAGYSERLTAIISTALYTDCPVRYKGLSFQPSGFGQALSAAYMEDRDIQPYVDVLKYQFILQVIRNKESDEGSSMVVRFDSCRAFINQTKLGFGLERCIYFLDANCPCLSPIVKNYYIQSSQELMQAFEDLCSKSSPQILFDRHIVAFLSIRDKRNIDHHIKELSATEPHNRILSQLRLLATIQR